MRYRLEDLQRKSGWLILALLGGAILTVYAFLGWADREARHAQAEVTSGQVAYFSAQSVSGLFHIYDRALATLAERSRSLGLETVGSSRGHWQLLVDLLPVTPKARSMGIAGPDGGVLLHSALFGGAAPTSIADSDVFKALAADPSGGLVIGAPYQTSAQQTLVMVARAVTDARGSLQAVVFLTTEPMAFDFMAELPTLTEGGWVAINRADGVTLFRTPDLAAPAQSDILHFELGSPPPPSHLMAYRKVPDFPLVLVVGMSNAVVDDAWMDAWIHNGFFVALALLGFTMLAIRLQRQMDRVTRLQVEVHQKAAQQAKRVEAEMRQLATTDGLTGLVNRRHFLDLAEQEMRRFRRYGGQLSLIMLDADHFKRVNDQYGHAGGDDALRHLAREIGSRLRESDVFGRLGGEEFAILLPGADAQGAAELAERLREAVARAPVTSGERQFPLTISLGVVTCDGSESVDEALHRADLALYQSKERGRNRVTVAEAA